MMRKLIIGLALVIGLNACSPHSNAYKIFQNSADKVFYMMIPGMGGGTGFLVKAKSGKVVLITNDHICHPSKTGTLDVYQDGDTVAKSMKIIKTYPELDLCVVEAPRTDKYLEVDNSYGQIPTWAYVVGHPKLLPITITEGVTGPATVIKVAVEDEYCDQKLSHVERREVMTFFGPVQACVAAFKVRYTSARIFGGNSGSPVIDNSGRVIGVISLGANDNSAGYFVMKEDLQRVLAEF